MNILIAEDERITRRSLERSLSKWGHCVTVAEDGARAWERFQSEPFDAVLTDWQMPGLSGLDLVRKIRERTDGHYVYVVLLTSRSETEDLVAALDEGADDFLSKPFAQSELRARLSAGERIIRLERELADRNAQMSRDLNVAANYVRSLIPEPRSAPEFIDWRYLPAYDLAGDSLGFHEIDAQHLALYVLDVTGHGVDSALLSVTILNVVKSMSFNIDYRDPSAVLARLNDSFPMQKHEDRCFSMWYGVFHRPSRTLRWAGGGHPPAFLIENGQTSQLASSGPLLGMLPEMDFPSESQTLVEGGRLFVYSDGVYEIEQPDGEQWGLDRFFESLPSFVESEKDAKDAILQHVQQIGLQTELEDDFTILEVVF